MSAKRQRENDEESLASTIKVDNMTTEDVLDTKRSNVEQIVIFVPTFIPPQVISFIDRDGIKYNIMPKLGEHILRTLAKATPTVPSVLRTYNQICALHKSAKIEYIPSFSHIMNLVICLHGQQPLSPEEWIAFEEYAVHSDWDDEEKTWKKDK